MQELARFLVQVPDPIEWGHYIDLIAQRLRLDVREVRDEVQRAARAGREEERRQAQRERARQQAADAEPQSQADPASRRTPLRARTGRAQPRTGVREAAPGAGPGPPLRGGAGAPARPERPRARTGAGDVSEEHLVAILVLAPHLLRRMPVRLTPEDFRQHGVPRALPGAAAHVGGRAGAGAGEARAAGRRRRRGRRDGDPIGSRLDVSLRGYYDRVRAQGRKEPYHTEAQLEAAVAVVVRRIRERNLREELREAQYLLQETSGGDERNTLERRVERLAAQLGRVQLERSRSALYTSAPN